MSDDATAVYRVDRPLRVGGGDRHDVGDLLIDPEEWIPRRLSSYLTRLDEEGRIPRETLRGMHYQTLQQLAAAGDAEAVDGNSELEDIIDAYALDEGSDDG
jgi:hypothetical protein